MVETGYDVAHENAWVFLCWLDVGFCDCVAGAKADPKKIDAIDFSAGAHLAVVLSTHPGSQGSVPASTADTSPNFQMIVYPAYTVNVDGIAAGGAGRKRPPTFPVQAENDLTARVESSLGYYLALKNARVLAEMAFICRGWAWIRDAAAAVPTA